MGLALHAIPEFFSIQPDNQGAWAGASSLKLALHAEGNRCKVAVARYAEIAVFAAPCTTASHSGNLRPQPDQAVTLLHASTCIDTVTDLEWLALCQQQQPKTPAPTPHSPQARPNTAAQDWAPGALTQAAQSARHDVQAADPLAPSSSARLRPEVAGDGSCPVPSTSYLLVGTSAGYLQLHDARGQLLLRQRLHTGAVQRIQLRSSRMGISPGPGQEDVTITFADSIARISCLDLQATLAAAQEDTRTEAQTSTSCTGGFFGSGVASGSSAARARGKAPALGPVPFQRWDLPRGARCCLEAVCIGLKPQDLYSALQGPRQGRGDEQRLLFAAGGEAPVLYSLEVKVQAAQGTLAMLQGLVTSLTSATSSAVGMARAAGARAVNTPANLAAGLRSFVLAPFTSAPSPAAQGTSPPVVTFDALPTAAQSRVDTAALGVSLKDEQRVLTCLVPAPSGPLLAAVDTLGRLLLVDGVHITILRMWKGYRDAQCAWLEVPHCWISNRLRRLEARQAGRAGGSDADLLQQPSLPGDQHVTAACHGHSCSGADLTAGGSCGCCRSFLLAVYIPRRQLVEVWQAHEGKRLLALTQVGAHCRLLAARQVGEGQREGLEGAGSCVAPGPMCCFLFDGAQGAITDLGALVKGKC